MRSSILLAVAWLCLTLTGSAVGQSSGAPIYRLPSTVTPMSYMLRLEPDLDSMVVNGVMMINLLTMNESVNSITMHLGTDPTVDETSVYLMDSAGVEVTIGSFIYDDANTLITVELPSGSYLSINTVYTISIPFQSVIYTEPTGLFSGSFNSTSKYLASYFRPTYARNAFPCFDEPQYKVPITLQVVRPTTYNVVFMTSATSSVTNTTTDTVLDTFNTTDAISIHSFGLFMSQVTAVSSTMGVNLYAPSGTASSVTYLADILSGISTLGAFPIAPLNLVVLPDKLYTSFATFGFVFTSPEVYSGTVVNAVMWPRLRLELTEAFLRQFLEYAKTPSWWSDLWLSESVGRFMALSFQSESDYDAYQNIMRIEVRSEALGADFSDSNSPVVNDNLLSRFDIVSVIANQTVLLKGLSTLIMWNDTMPKGLVTETILEYIQLSDTVVTTDTLVNIMVTNILADGTYNVSAAIPLLPYWLNATGHPVLAYSAQDNTTLVLTQSFGCDTDSTTGPVWPISVSYATNSSHNWTDYQRGDWLLDPAASFTADSDLEPWAILNLEAAPVRMDYGSSWDSALSVLATDDYSAPQTVKAGLQDDSVALALSGCLSFSTALSALTSAERTLYDWYPVAKAFKIFSERIGNNTYLSEAFAMYAATVFTEDELSALALTNANSTLAYSRQILTPWLCQFNISTCRDDVVTLSGQLLQMNMTQINENDYENVMCYGVRYSTSSVVDTLMTGYTAATDLLWKYLYTIGMGCLTDSDSVQTVLSAVLNDSSPLASSDAVKILIGLAGSVDNSPALVDFVVDNAYTLENMYGVESLIEVIKAMAKFNVDLSQIGTLNNVSLGLDPAVTQAAVDAVAVTNNLATWYSTYSASLEEILPQPTTEAPMTSAGSTNGTTTVGTTPSTSSAKSLMDFRVVSLIVAVAVTVLSTSL